MLIFLGRLKYDGFNTKSKTNEEINKIIKKNYLLDITIEKVLLNKKNGVPINSKNKWYIYLLIENNIVVYVGISKSLLYRVGQHQQDKNFDSIYCFELKESFNPKKEEFKFRR